VSGVPDINAGSYSVTTTVTNPNYVGSGSTPFTILQAPATIALSNLSQVYSGNPLAATATVTPAYCGPAAVSYDGSATAPSNIGTYAVVAAEANPNCTASNATGTLIVNAFAASSCVYALNPTARSAFSVADGAKLDAQCSIQVNSAARDAFDVDGRKSTVDATAISVVGGAAVDRFATVSSKPATGQTAAADPLAAVVAPTVGACVNTGDRDRDRDDNHGSKNITLNPGTYCGGINIHGRSTVTFNPGTYILLGGGLNIDGGAQVTGTGVTFYNTGDHEHRYQPIHIDGGSKTTLSAPVSGPLAGVLFFQDRAIVQKGDHDRDDHGDDNHPQPNVISGNTESSFAGALYFPTTPLIYSGGSEQDPAVYTLIVADTVSVAGHSNVSLTVLGTPMSDTDSDAACSPGPGKDCDHGRDGDHR
ncbi:MAG: MBG domain-containing protein, partial [Acidobacteriota bacterium]